MEIDEILIAVQRTLKIRTTYLDFNPENDTDLIKEISDSIKTNCPFLNHEVCMENNNDCRRIHLLLFLNTEFEINNYYKDNDELFHIIGVIPKLNPIFYLLLTNKLKLNQYFKEVLFYSSEVISNHLLNLVNKNIKFFYVYDTLHLYEDIIKIIYMKMKYLEIQYHQQQRDQQSDVCNEMNALSIVGKQNVLPDNDICKTIKLKYLKYVENFKIFGYEFCFNLMNNLNLNNIKEQGGNTIFEGFLLLSHIKILLFCINVECFNNNGQNNEVNSKQCIEISKTIEQFYDDLNKELVDYDYVTNWSDSKVKLEDTHIDLFHDCFEALLFDFIQVCTPITSKSWCEFYEYNLNNDRTLQTEIGEHAYYLNDLLKKLMQKGFENKTMEKISKEYLQHLCIKPETENDIVMKCLPEELLVAFKTDSKKIKTRSKWLNSALRFFNSHNDEILTIFETNQSHLTCEVTYCLHDMIMDRLLNDELELTTEDRTRLKDLLINCIDNLSLNDQIKVVVTFVEKYKDDLNQVFVEEYNKDGGDVEWFNRINNDCKINQICTESLKYIMKKPKDTLTKLLNLGLKCKLEENTILIKLLTDKILPKFGSLDLSDEGQGHYFLLDYVISVIDQVKMSILKDGVILNEEDDFPEEVIADGKFPAHIFEKDDNKTVQKVTDSQKNNHDDKKCKVQSYELTQNDFSNLKSLLKLFKQKKILSSVDVIEKCFWKQMSDTDMDFSSLTFISNMLLIYFEDGSCPIESNEVLNDMMNVLKSQIDRTSWTWKDYTKEKSSARQSLVLLMVQVHDRVKDGQVIMKLEKWNPLKLLFSNSTLTDLYGANESMLTALLLSVPLLLCLEEWKAYVSKLSPSNYMYLVNTVRIKIQGLKSRESNETYIAHLHQYLVCFVVVLKDIMMPNLIQTKLDLSPKQKIDLFKSLIYSLIQFTTDSNTTKLKMFYILSIQSILQKYLHEVLNSEEKRNNSRDLIILFTMVDNVDSRVQLARCVDLRPCMGTSDPYSIGT